VAAVAKSGVPSLSTIISTPDNTHVVASGIKAATAIVAGDACYIGSTGLATLSTGAAANAAAKVRGFAAMSASAGEAVTLLTHIEFRYGAGLTPGADLFLSAATAGALSDVATTGGTAPIGFVVDATRVRLFHSQY
jgi:hypothetical protein